MTHFIEFMKKKRYRTYFGKSLILYGWKRGLDVGPFDEGENDANVVGLEDDDGSRGDGGHP